MDTIPFRMRAAVRGTSALARVALVCALASTSMMGAGCASSRATERDDDGYHLLWVRAGRAYLVLRPGATAAKDDSVRLVEGRTVTAAGRITSIINGELAIVALTAGSIDSAKRPARLRVELIRSPALSPASVRVAIPTTGRNNLLLRCERVAPQLPANAPSYRMDRLDPHHVRFVRASGSSTVWPDTLLFVLFEDASDEEIALERGDVDVAVFWPGEASRRIRSDPRWRDSPLGAPGVDVLAIVGSGDLGSAIPDSSRAASFNRDLFRGDLEPISPAPPSPRLWIVPVDDALPGHGRVWDWMYQMEERGASIPPQGTSRPRLALVRTPPDSATAGTRPVFRIRYPVLCGESIRPWVSSVGADALASMVQCR